MNVLRQLASANPVPSDSVDQLAALLPPIPTIDALPPYGRRPGARRLILVAAVAVAAMAAPAFALRTQLAQTIHDFLASNAPPQAKTVIAAIVKSTAVPGRGTPDQVKLVVNATGPDGGVQLYELQFTNGDIGTTVVDTSNDPPRIGGGASWGPPLPLPPGEPIDVRGSGVDIQGTNAFYFDGIVNSEVGSVDVVYPDGHTQPVATGNGYMLGWIQPKADGHYGDGELLARDAQGNQIGRVDICELGRDLEFRPHNPTMPTDPTAACAIPPAPDHG
jgi:hypothetical protein